VRLVLRVLKGDEVLKEAKVVVEVKVAKER
jgi:hypothetical protein